MSVNRIHDIANVLDYRSLNRKPLVGVGFDKISLSDSFISSRARIENSYEIVIGNTSLFNKGSQILFVGLNIDILRLLLDQDFDRIIKYSKKSTTVGTRVLCKVRKTYTNNELTNLLDRYKYTPLNDVYFFHCKFEIHCTSAGIYLGAANLNDIISNG